jgi:hypothetical protein
MAEQALAPTGHSRFGFSGAERYLACPASVTAQEGLPDIESSYARRGTELHEAAAKALFRQEDAADVLPEDDEEGREIVQLYLDTVREAHARLMGPGTVLLIERQFHLAEIHPELWGTADAVIIAPAHRTVWVGDLKTGAGKAVRPRREDGTVNVQLGGYGLGGLQMVRPGTPIDKVEVCVIQPLNGGVMTTTVDIADMADLAANLQEGVELALQPVPKFGPGDHCRWCKAAPTCKALEEFVFTQAQAEFSDGQALTSNAESLTASDISVALKAADVIDAWITVVRETAFAMLQRGEPVPGHKLVQKQGRRKWVNEEKAAQELIAVGLQSGDIHSMVMKSPAQVEKAMKKRGVELSLANLAPKTSSGFSMVSEDDPRPAVPAGPAADFTVQPDEF